MATPKIDYDKASRALVDAVILGDKQAATKHGVTHVTISRWRKRCETDEKLAKAVNEKTAMLCEQQDEGWLADDLLGQIRDLLERTLAILDKAEDGEDFRTALSAIREGRGLVELLARLVGELQTGDTYNIAVNPQWIEIRGEIMDALVPFPEARIAVARRLADGE